MLRTKLVVFALLPFCALACVTQSTASYADALTVTVENDTFTGSDNNYTNGIGATWVSNDLHSYDDDRFVSKWGRFWSFLPFVGDDLIDHPVEFSLKREHLRCPRCVEVSP